MPDFDELFKRATGNDPFPYQRRFAEAKEFSELVDAPTVWRIGGAVNIKFDVDVSWTLR
jgi:hypothetical protein